MTGVSLVSFGDVVTVGLPAPLEGPALPPGAGSPGLPGAARGQHLQGHYQLHYNDSTTDTKGTLSTLYFKNRSLDLTLSDFPARKPEYVHTYPAGGILFGF